VHRLYCRAAAVVIKGLVEIWARGAFACIRGIRMPERDFHPGKVLMRQYTQKQGQYLAFIYYYSKLHGYPPAEADMQRYFKVTAPAVHQMILTLEKCGLIERVPGQPRTIRVLLPRAELPDLE
jgi:hypothetical protein